MLPLILEHTEFVIFHNLLSLCWQITIVVGLGMFFARWLRRSPSSLQHVIWVGMLVLLPLLPLLAWLAASTGTPQVEIPVIPTFVPRAESNIEPVDEYEEYYIGSQCTPEPVAPVEPTLPSPPLWRYIVFFYVAGVMGFAGMALWGRGRIYRWVMTGVPVDDVGTRLVFRHAHEQLGLKRDVRVIQHPDIPEPISVGVFHSTVLVPTGFLEGLTTEDLRAFALHELAHVKRHDPLVFAIITIIRFLFFFHPLVWYAAGKISLLAEYSCDDIVLDQGAKPSAYAQMLARSARLLMRRSTYSRLSAGLFISRRSLSDRVKAVLSNSRDNCGRLTRGIVGLVVAASVTVVAVAIAFPLTPRNQAVFSDIRSAIMFGRDDRAIELLHTNSWLVGMEDKDGRSLVHLATGYGRKRVLKSLFEMGSDIDAQDQDGLTPLHLAAQNSDLELIQLLIKQGARVDICDKYDRTALYVSMESGDVATSEFLTRMGVPIDIITACALEKYVTVDSFLDREPSLVNAVDHNGMTPLHLTAITGNESIAERLLSEGADTNARNYEGETPLHLAVWHSNQQLTSLLIEHGADVNALNHYGLSPLMLARERGHGEIEGILLAHDAVSVPVNMSAREAWKRYREAPYSERAFLTHMIAGGNPSMRQHDCWCITSVYHAGRCGSVPLYVVKIRNTTKDSDSMYIFDDAGTYMGSMGGERAETWMLDSDFNFDTGSVEIVKRN